MISFNRGEWSEIYGVLFLLVKPKLKIVDSNLNEVNDTIFFLKKIFLDLAIKLEYVIDVYTSTIIIFANSEEVKTYSQSTIDIERIKLLKKIKEQASSGGAFTIPSLDSFIQNITCNDIFKSKSNSKSDIATLVLDNIKSQEVNLNYSIKSLLGSPATILNASSKTNFRYKIENFSDQMMNEVNIIDTRTKLLDRIKKIKSYPNVKISFDKVVSDTFEQNLKMVDTRLPEFLGNALLYSYEHDNKNLKEIFGLANPILNSKLVNKKLGDFLNGISFGFVPGKKWNGLNSVNGGLIVVKEDGDVVVLDLVYYSSFVNDYLIQQSKLDSPSSSRYHMLEIKKEKGNYYFDLNLQVRYK